MITEKNENKITVKDNDNYNNFSNILKEHKINNNIDKNFCEECSVIYSIDIKCLKHNKFNYKIELSPIEIEKKMRENIIDNYKNNNIEKIDNCYLEKRKNLFSLIYKTSLKMNFKSQTYFLSIYFLDVIFSNEESIKIIKSENINYENLSLSCLLIASKYCENDLFVPVLSSYKKAFEISSLYIQNISNEEILYYEILTLKLLKYKLNYYTIYDFITFFFCHGIIIDEQINDLNNNLKNSKILENIYIKSRDYLDDIINKVHTIKFNSCLIAIYILEKKISEVMKNDCDKDYLSKIFEKIYNINYKNDIEYNALKEEINKEAPKLELRKDYYSSLILRQPEYYSPRNKIILYKDNNLYNSRNNNNSKSKNFINSIFTRHQSIDNKSNNNFFSKSIFSSLKSTNKNESERKLNSYLNNYNNNNILFTYKLKNMNSHKSSNFNYNYLSSFKNKDNNNFFNGNLRGINSNFINKTHHFINMINNDSLSYSKNPSSIINNNININIGKVNNSLGKNYHNYITLTNKKYLYNYKS